MLNKSTLERAPRTIKKTPTKGQIQTGKQGTLRLSSFSQPQGNMDLRLLSEFKLGARRMKRATKKGGKSGIRANLLLSEELASRCRPSEDTGKWEHGSPSPEMTAGLPSPSPPPLSSSPLFLLALQTLPSLASFKSPG